MNFKELKQLIIAGNEEEFTSQAENSQAAVIAERDEFGCSLLDWAAIYNQPEITSFLCQHYPALLILRSTERSALQYAARHGSLKSLQILINQPGNLEHKDHNQKTALELAIQYKHANCARLLLNNGAKSPADIDSLVELINPFGFTLYCKPDGLFQLLNEEEINLLETTGTLSTLTIRQKSKYNRKFYSLKINPQEAEDILLKLIDKYLYYFNRIHKEEREEKHGASNAKIQERVKLSRAKRESLLKIIRLIVSATNGHHINQSWLAADITAQPELLRFLVKEQNSKQRHFGDDLSDDSDSEEENAYLQQLRKPAELVDAKAAEYVKTAKRQTHRFWLKTKMDTPKNAGLKKKITQVSASLKKGANQEAQLNSLKDIEQKTLIKALQERGKIEYEKAQQTEALKIIGQINACPPEKLAELLKKTKPVFILGTRGINYMLDRWNADARRYHRGISEDQQPQYSEAILKLLPYDYYTDLDPEHDFHQNSEEELLLQKEALRLNAFLQSLNKSGPCISYSATHSYLFNSVGDALQDHFSNGVDNHLNDLSTKRSASPKYWGTHLKNSFNPGVAIGSRPYHALKYTYGLKKYYPRSMMPRYWNNGTIEYSHIGKVYLSLHPLEEILSDSGPNNLSIQDRQARVSIGDQISPEKELSFLGFMPSDRVFHQFVAKFPSFNGPWKNIYKFKYGLDKETYEAFQHLINVTQPETKETSATKKTTQRDRVINLLAEWLCAYHEVLLIDIAKEEAIRRDGILAYLDRDGKLNLEPENGRIFTRGQNNIALRNELHIMRELRIELVEHLDKLKEDKKTIPEFDLVAFDDITRILQTLSKKETFLAKIASATTDKGEYKIQLTTEDEGLITAEESTADEIRVEKSRTIIRSLIRHGLYANSSPILYQNRVTHLIDQEHLYTDLEINALLHQVLDNLPNVEIYASQHPLIRGEFEEHCQRFFIDELKRIFHSNRNAIMPVEVSQEELDEDAYLNMNGIHWNGLFISKINDHTFKVELIDPAHSPRENIILTGLSAEQINRLEETVKNLLRLIQQAAHESHASVQVHWLATRQQAGDLDCGAWTVDNLIRRAQNLPLRARDEVTGEQLRQAHDIEYTKRLSLAP